MRRELDARTPEGRAYRLARLVDERHAKEQEVALLHDWHTDFIDRAEFDVRLLAREDKKKAEAARRALAFLKSRVSPLIGDREYVLTRQIEELEDVEAELMATMGEEGSDGDN